MSNDPKLACTTAQKEDPKSGTAGALGRRAFLGAVAAGVAALPGEQAHAQGGSGFLPLGPAPDPVRAAQAFNIRMQAADLEAGLPLLQHPSNGDEDLYPNKIASYSKGLPHNELGEVRLDAYFALIRAVTTLRSRDFENIPMGGARKLVNPQAALAFDLSAPDSHQLAQPPAPRFDRAEMAAEIAENYWMALLRDVHFSDYAASDLAHAAAADLSTFADFRAAKVGGRVTVDTLFRGNTPGDLSGPYVSQFLLRNIPYGSMTIAQRYNVPLAEIDYGVTYLDWLLLQRGSVPGRLRIDPVTRYIRNGRDLGEFVHNDFSYQAYLNAALILLGIAGAEDDANPYKTSRSQIGNITLGRADVLDCVARAANSAFKAVWYQKWMVHRRVRPETYAGRIHNHVTGAARYVLHPEILNSPVLGEVFKRQGTFLLAQAFAEGSPTHPSYGGGHATIAGACATVLKAFFKESFVLPNPVVAAPDGQTLVPYAGPPLTVGGELNKLAANIAFARDFAGIHYRSDCIESIKLGEAVAIGMLHELRLTYHERFDGFSLTRFDGTTVTI